jgi:hypothetical protein
MFKIFKMTFTVSDTLKRIKIVLLPLLLLLSGGIKAEEISTRSTSTQRCENKGATPSEKKIIQGIETILSDFTLYFTDAASNAEGILAHGYVERTRRAMTGPVDHMHARCWNKDQLSCSMLLSTLHEMSSFLSSLERSNPAKSLRTIVTKVEGQALALTQFCRNQPWKLS